MKFAAVEIIERQFGRPDDPESALELLSWVVGEAARGYFRDLATCLGAVRTVGQASNMTIGFGGCWKSCERMGAI